MDRGTLSRYPTEPARSRYPTEHGLGFHKMSNKINKTGKPFWP